MYKLFMWLFLVISLSSSSLFAKNGSHVQFINLAVIKKHIENDLTPMVPTGAGGIVGIMKSGEKPEFIAIGRVAANSDISVNKNTLSLVGSTSKMFAGLLSMRLVELHALSLDAELGSILANKYFEIFDNAELAKHITLRQILSHTSGLQYDTDCDRNERVNQGLKSILDNMLLETQRDPTKKIKFTNNPKDHVFSYSNQIWIATIFIEKAYNQFLQSQDGKKHYLSYADILDKEIIKPLHMSRTGFQTSEHDWIANDKNKMLSYVEKIGIQPAYSYKVNTLDPIQRAIGGVWTTPADLIQLASSISMNGLITREGKVLISKENIQKLILPHGINGQVGLGVYHENSRVGKGGSLYSYGSNFEIDLEAGNAVVSLINFRPTVPVKFDARALLALDDMGSKPRLENKLSEQVKNSLRQIKNKYEKSDIEIYGNLYVSKFGYIAVKKVNNGLIMNWNGNIITAGKSTSNKYIIFDDEYRDGTEVKLGIGPDSHLSYLFFENGNDNSQAFKQTSQHAIPRNVSEAVDVINNENGIRGITYQGTRPDGVGSVTIRVDKTLHRVLAQSEGKEVPILITKIIKNTRGEIVEIWMMGNHFIVPDKLTKLIKRNNQWVLAIAIFDNPNINVEYLKPALRQK